MESSRLFFDTADGCHGGNMMFLGKADHVFRGSRSMLSMDEISKKRPFFSSPDDIYEEEYYDEQPEKKRRLTPEQVHQLEKSFETENKLEPDRKCQLAKKLGLQTRQVAVWFQNRRARWKTKQLERDYDILKSSYDSLLAKFDSVHKENEKLKSEMTSLTTKNLEIGNKIDEKVIGAEELAPVNPLLVEAVKAEDRVSSGSGGSAVVDNIDVDTGDSFFQYVVVEDDVDGGGGSDVGQNYFTADAFAASDEHEEEGEPMGWWVWHN